MTALGPSPACPEPAPTGLVDPAPGPRPAHGWFTPRAVARDRRVRVAKILTWIRSGELEAINHASSRLAKPRWRISAEALAMFDLGCSSRSALAPPTASRPRRARGLVVTEYFK